MLKNILISLSLMLLVLAFLVIRPVPVVSEDKLIVEKGVVSDIFESGEKDIVFLLEENNRKFYINRGLQAGLEINTLRERLTGNQIVLKYPKYWTPLDWNNQIKHIS